MYVFFFASHRLVLTQRPLGQPPIQEGGSPGRLNKEDTTGFPFAMKYTKHTSGQCTKVNHKKYGLTTKKTQYM